MNLYLLIFDTESSIFSTFCLTLKATRSGESREKWKISQKSRHVTRQFDFNIPVLNNLPSSSALFVGLLYESSVNILLIFSLLLFRCSAFPLHSSSSVHQRDCNGNVYSLCDRENGRANDDDSTENYTNENLHGSLIENLLFSWWKFSPL